MLYGLTAESVGLFIALLNNCLYKSKILLLTMSIKMRKKQNFHRVLYTIHEPIYFEDSSISGELFT